MTETRVFGEPFLRHLHRHFINLMCFDRGELALSTNQGQPAIYNFSAFIVEISDRWFGITAGHIFRTLEKAVEAGSILTDWQIDDSLVSSKPQMAYRIPFDIDKDVAYFYDEGSTGELSGIDYAYFELNPLARIAIAAEGVSPIPQTIWEAQDVAEFSLWLLVGTPYELAHLAHGEPFVKHHVTVLLERVHELPAGLADTHYRRLYAKIDFDSIGDNGRFDIQGMSGGPIFGLKPDTNSNTYDYRLIGIQSAWNERDHVALCAAYPFLYALKSAIEGGVRPSTEEESEGSHLRVTSLEFGDQGPVTGDAPDTRICELGSEGTPETKKP